MILLIILLVVLWAAGLLGNIGGGLINILIVVAVIAFLYEVFVNRRDRL